MKDGSPSSTLVKQPTTDGRATKQVCRASSTAVAATTGSSARASAFAGASASGVAPVGVASARGTALADVACDGSAGGDDVACDGVAVGDEAGEPSVDVVASGRLSDGCPAVALSAGVAGMSATMAS